MICGRSRRNRLIRRQALGDEEDSYLFELARSLIINYHIITASYGRTERCCYFLYLVEIYMCK